AGGGEVPAVRAEGDAGDAHAVGLEIVGELAGGRVIDFHDSRRAVVYVGQEPAVGAKLHAPGAAHEDGLQGGKSLPARRHVPNNDLAIPARRGQEPAVGAEGDAIDRLRMAGQAMELRTRL